MCVGGINYLRNLTELRSEESYTDEEGDQETLFDPHFFNVERGNLKFLF